MFAYCGNNPVNHNDPSGHVFVDAYLDPNQQAGIEWGEWYVNSDENETDKNGRLTLNAKIKRTYSSIFYNIEISAGVGVGFGHNYEIMDINRSIMGHYDPIAIQYSDGNWMIGDRFELSATVSATQAFEVGGAVDCFRENGVPVDPTAWIIYNNTKESWTIFEFSNYDFFLGGNISVGFDVNTFLWDINNIWR